MVACGVVTTPWISSAVRWGPQGPLSHGAVTPQPWGRNRPRASQPSDGDRPLGPLSHEMGTLRSSQPRDSDPMAMGRGQTPGSMTIRWWQTPGLPQLWDRDPEVLSAMGWGPQGPLRHEVETPRSSQTWGSNPVAMGKEQTLGSMAIRWWQTPGPPQPWAGDPKVLSAMRQ